MADFEIHLAGGVVSGAGFSVAGVVANSLSMTQAGAVFTVGTFAALISDLDSDTGKPLKLKYGIIPGMKKSSGSALKLKSNSLLTTMLVYTLLAMVVITNLILPH